LRLILSAGRGKARRFSPAEQAEEGKSPNNKTSRRAEDLSVHGPLVAVSSPVSSPKSQLKGEKQLLLYFIMD